jgi:hypothetical protein
MAENIFVGRAGCLIRCEKTRGKTLVGRDVWHFLSRKRERAKSRKLGESGEWKTIDRSGMR